MIRFAAPFAAFLVATPLAVAQAGQPHKSGPLPEGPGYAIAPGTYSNSSLDAATRAVGDKSQADHVLRADGYTDIHALQRADDGGWTAEAKHDGHPVSVRIDRQGKVIPQ